MLTFLLAHTDAHSGILKKGFHFHSRVIALKKLKSALLQQKFLLINKEEFLIQTKG